MARKIEVASSVEEMQQQTARTILAQAATAIAERGRFTIALSGGSTVGAIYRLLAGAEGVDWPRWHFFWGDERCVELDNPYSNYKLAAETLFTPAGLLRYGQVYPVMQPMVPPREAARRYEATIRQFFATPAGEWPVLDLCLNGMGPDGHTASLFPRAPLGRSKTQVAKMTHAGHQPWVDRVTLTVPVFNHARCVVVCATGTEKAERLKAVLEGAVNPRLLPAQSLDPVNGEVIWMLEPGIARLLQGRSAPGG